MSAHFCTTYDPDFWTASEGRSLLKKALGRDFLHRTGVTTLSGWWSMNRRLSTPSGEPPRHETVFFSLRRATLVFLDNDELVWISETLNWPGGAKDSIKNGGLLLPAPNPTDVATWAVLLDEYMSLVYRNRCPRPFGLTLGASLHRNKFGEWQVAVTGAGFVQYIPLVRVEQSTTDPSLVLIQAMAAEREAWDKKSSEGDDDNA